ncbi:MAG: response regulator [Chlorobia bacterium]|nr:response regulator [Fimbriimonadaceae bacterium]
MPEPLKLVVIEDEAPIRKFLRASFSEEDASIYEATTGEDGIRAVAHRNPTIVLLDLGLPDIDGLEVVRRLREWTQVPIIVISARGKEQDKVSALDLGADDYLTKPFSIGELMARVRVALRHAKRDDLEAPPTIEIGDLKIDLGARIVTLTGQEVRLTAIEYKLLAILARHSGKVITQKQMLNEVWGPAYEDSTHTLRVHMANLRQKIEPEPTQTKFIRTETGVGYRLMESE